MKRAQSSESMQKMASSTEGLLCYCRPGFESELAAELIEKSARCGMHGYVQTEKSSGLVRFLGVNPLDVCKQIRLDQLIFSRQLLALFDEIRISDSTDRIGPILRALESPAYQSLLPFGDVCVEHSDGDAYRDLSGLARALTNALRPKLKQAKLITARGDANRARLTITLLSGTHLLLGSAMPGNCSPHPGGILRLRFLQSAPSRSALKLEEAFQILLNARERELWLRSGMRAADLGAAPGGWTWVLTRHQMQVIAIDNGPMQPELMASGLVEHQRADGFRWLPSQALDWMVCDMVESPARVASLMGQWLRDKHCRRTVFNLKLPMKKRYEETIKCLEILQDQAQTPLLIRAKQLYHDREEITVLATPEGTH